MTDEESVRLPISGTRSRLPQANESFAASIMGLEREKGLKPGDGLVDGDDCRIEGLDDLESLDLWDSKLLEVSSLRRASEVRVRCARARGGSEVLTMSLVLRVLKSPESMRRISRQYPSSRKRATILSTSPAVRADCTSEHQAEAISAGDALAPRGPVAGRAECSFMTMLCLKRVVSVVIPVVGGEEERGEPGGGEG
jgi:hypothetical protein